MISSVRSLAAIGPARARRVVINRTAQPIIVQYQLYISRKFNIRGSRTT